NLYNSNSKIHDNTVFLDWSTTKDEVDGSELLQVCDRFFSVQQRDVYPEKAAIRHYFDDDYLSVFRKFLDLSFHKPRDFLTFIKLLKKMHVASGVVGSKFDVSKIYTPEFTRLVSEYLLGEVRNYSAFYMTQDDFGKYLKFFQYLNGSINFGFADFANAYKGFIGWARGENFSAREYLRDPEALLQLFYDVNVIGYSEVAESDRESFYHWSYRERSLNNISPKVKPTERLRINAGVAKALD